jgi:hypothetical protein
MAVNSEHPMDLAIYCHVDFGLEDMLLVEKHYGRFFLSSDQSRTNASHRFI